MAEMRRIRSRTPQNRPSDRQRGAVAPPAPRVRTRADGRPDWEAVERVIAELARTHGVFRTRTSEENWISAYSPDRRILIETPGRSAWVQVEHLQACWATFERLGRITRRDVLEPGRCSGLVMALFARVPGVVEVDGDEPELVIGTP